MKERNVSNYQAYTIEMPLHLDQDTLNTIRQLVDACEAEEPAPVRISWNMLQARPGLAPLDFCCYLDGRLVGYLFMDHYDPKERETIILVHPAYRRRGIAHALLVAAHEECRRAGIERIILICERRAVAGKRLRSISRPASTSPNTRWRWACFNHARHPLPAAAEASADAPWLAGGNLLSASQSSR